MFYVLCEYFVMNELFVYYFKVLVKVIMMGARKLLVS